MDVGFASHRLARHIARPVKGSVEVATCVVRYLAEYPDLTILYPWQTPQEGRQVVVYTDSDWANCSQSRKSVSGGVMVMGRHLIHHWTRLQPIVAQSSAEAELVSSANGIAELISEIHLLHDLGECPQPSLRVDARACRGMVLRKGSGRVKHLSIRYLWTQRAIREYAILVEYVPRHLNVSDALTHAVFIGELARVLSAIDCRRACI